MNFAKPTNESISLPGDFISTLKFDACGNRRRAGPKISVVMPCFNQAEFIERSILSVLNQGYSNLEFIVIDGGSIDGTVNVIKKYEKFLAYWVSEPDNGQSDALNKGFARATGDIYGWMNSDDLYMPGAFEAVVSAFAENPEKKIVFGDWLSIDVNDRILSKFFAFDFNLNHFKYEGFHLNAQAMMWRKEVHRNFAGGFGVDLHNTMDYQMILAFGLNEGEAAFLRLPQNLACFRRYDAQKTGNFDDRVSREHRALAEQYKYSDKYESIGRVKRYFYRFRRAYWYLKRGGTLYFLNKLRHGN